MSSPRCRRTISCSAASSRGTSCTREYATTGDGLLTGLRVADLVRRTGRPLSALAAQMTRVPQVLVNVRVARRVDVGASAGARRRPCARVEAELGDTRPGAGAGVGHRAARAGDDRGRRPVRGRRGRGTAPQRGDLGIRDRRRSPVEFRRCAASWAWFASRGDRVAPDLAALAAHAGRGRGAARADGRRPMGGPTVAALESAARDPARGRPRSCARATACGALVDDPIAPGRARAPRRPGRRAARRDRGPPRRERARRRRHRGAERRADHVQGRAVVDPQGPHRPRGRGRRPARRHAVGPGRARGVPRGADHAVGDRPARGARPRLGRACTSLVTGHGLDLDDPDDRAPRRRARRAIRCSPRARCARPTGHLAFVYKTAAEIGELGDNTARLRAQIRDDELLHLALRADTAQASVLAHTRWASIGIISEANAHPLNQEELDGDGRVDGSRAYTIAALNGDVDNYADLKALDGLHFPAEITTDAKVIPALVARRIERGRRPRRGVPLDGRVVRGFGRDRRCSRPPIPIACCSRNGAAGRRSTSASRPTRSSWRASRTASSPSATRTCASTARRWSIPGNPASQGQVVVLDRRRAGTLAGIRRLSYDGRELPVDEDDVHVAADHDARRRPRRRAALPPEGDHRGARRRSARRCAPRSSSATACSTCASRAETLPDDVLRRAAFGRDPARARDRAGHRRDRGPESRAGAARRDRREPGRRWRRRSRPSSRASVSPPT